MKDGQIEITNWLNSDRNYEDGAFLYNKYGRNPQLKHLFSRPGKDAKLAYELGKLVGLGFTDAGTVDVALDSQGVPDPNAGSVDGVPAVPPSGNVVENHAYPPVVNRIIAELSRLYNERGLLKKQQNSVPDENVPEHVAQRKLLIDQIGGLSARLDVLYRAKEAYLTAGTMPDESELFPTEKPVEAGNEIAPEDLLKKRNNLRSQVTRARNMLEYQIQKKGGKPNPMPACPKRTELEERIRVNEAELADIERRIGSVD